MTRSNEVVKVTTPNRIRDWMQAHPDGGLSTEIAKALGVDVSMLHGHLADMEQRGELTKCVIERPGQRTQVHFRATAMLGNVRRAFPWKEFRVDRKPMVPRAPDAPPVARPAPVALVPVAPPVAHVEAAASVAEEVPEAAATPTAEVAAEAPAREERVSTQPRFALYSDGTLIMEGLPHLPEIVVLHREHTRLLLDYLAGEVHA